MSVYATAQPLGSPHAPATAMAPYTPREPDDALTTTQRRLRSKSSGTCTSTRCGCRAAGSFAKALYSRPGTVATLP